MALRGDRLRDSREAKGLKQREFARLSGVTEFQISRYENGKSEATTTTLEIMARHLEVSADYLLGLVDEPDRYFGQAVFPRYQKLIAAYEAGDAAALVALVYARLEKLDKLPSEE